MKKPQDKHLTLLHWGQCMTCHTSVRRLTAALHNPQGHSHHKPYVSVTALCAYGAMSQIFIVVHNNAGSSFIN